MNAKKSESVLREVWGPKYYFILHISQKKDWGSVKKSSPKPGTESGCLIPARVKNFHTAKKKIQPIFKLENRFILITGIS